MNVPEIRFTNSRGVRIAYQTWGTGPPVVMVPPLVSNLEVQWEHELYRRVLEYQGRYTRVLMFDKRGSGLSDRPDEAPTLEQRIADISAVMDAEGVERASVAGISEGGLMCQLFAARCPERVDRVYLLNSLVGAKDLPTIDLIADAYGSVDAFVTKFRELIESWGVDPGFFARWFSPSQSDNEPFVRWGGRYQRLGATQADLRLHLSNLYSIMFEHGAGMLEDIQAPTLVMHVVGDRVMPVEFGRLLAKRIRGAEYLEVDGDDHFVWIQPNWRHVLNRGIEFLTGRPVVEHELTHRFAVVLFTDIVDSTTTAARVGDATWREMLDSHDRAAWLTVDRHAGRIVKTTGDGILAIFDSPSSAVRCAADLAREFADIGLEIRAGLHAGEIEIRDEIDITGLAVHVAARVEQTATPGQILMSGTLRDILLGTDTKTTDAGHHNLKGIDGTWHLYALQAG